jgi:uncharacterized protein YbbK (DUF523 family)
MDKTITMKYIVSACLAGEKCRYDGNSNTDIRIKAMVENGSAIPVCPELLGGLPVPRVRCEQRLTSGSREIIGEDRGNYTDAFTRGAILSLEIAEKNGITQAILKSRSPSCGCGSIYDGTFSGKLIDGRGITADLFIKSGIKVFTENNFE